MLIPAVSPAFASVASRASCVICAMPDVASSCSASTYCSGVILPFESSLFRSTSTDSTFSCAGPESFMISVRSAVASIRCWIVASPFSHAACSNCSAASDANTSSLLSAIAPLRAVSPLARSAAARAASPPFTYTPRDATSSALGTRPSNCFESATLGRADAAFTSPSSACRADSAASCVSWIASTRPAAPAAASPNPSVTGFSAPSIAANPLAPDRSEPLIDPTALLTSENPDDSPGSSAISPCAGPRMPPISSWKFANATRARSSAPAVLSPYASACPAYRVWIAASASAAVAPSFSTIPYRERMPVFPAATLPTISEAVARLIPLPRAKSSAIARSCSAVSASPVVCVKVDSASSTSSSSKASLRPASAAASICFAYCSYDFPVASIDVRRRSLDTSASAAARAESDRKPTTAEPTSPAVAPCNALKPDAALLVAASVFASPAEASDPARLTAVPIDCADDAIVRNVCDDPSVARTVMLTCWLIRSLPAAQASSRPTPAGTACSPAGTRSGSAESPRTPTSPSPRTPPASAA